MGYREYTGPRLPGLLLDQIGGSHTQKRTSQWKRNKDSYRDDERRGTKHGSRPIPSRSTNNGRRSRREEVEEDDSEEELGDLDEDEGDEDDEEGSEDEESVAAAKSDIEESKAKSKSEVEDTTISNKKQPSIPKEAPKASRKVQKQLDEDDAEIAALEKKLGIKSKKIPKAFQDDGLDDILGDIDDPSDTGRGTKRSLEDEEWLAKKRRRASQEDDGDEVDSEDGHSVVIEVSEDEEDEAGSSNEEVDDFEGFESEATDRDDFDEVNEEQGINIKHKPVPQQVTKPKRENPYIAPGSDQATSQKYIPPSMRDAELANEDVSKRIHRQAQGLLNRLSEANIMSIINDIEKLYRDNARQYVTSTLITLLLDLHSDPTALNDTFIILHAAFVTAVYRIIGADFGAQFLERFVERFDSFPRTELTKQPVNLMSLLSQLYNFQLISSTFIFDYIRIFLSEVSEQHTELLLRVVRLSGAQLRSDDPSSLKDVVQILQQTIASQPGGHEALSVRTRFMIETLTNLKNNKLKNAAAPSAVLAEHSTRLKKSLGTLSARGTARGTEPLRLSLTDVRNSDKRGKWWLVGASWKPASDPTPTPASAPTPARPQPEGELSVTDLAAHNRMNTAVRRAIFVALASAADWRDARTRLLKLGLTKAQQLEISRVLLHCAAAEAPAYNPYYALVGRAVCAGDRRARKAFEFATWDVFRRMETAAEDEGEEGVSLEATVCYARLVADLVGHGGMGISVLKNVDLLYARGKTRAFAEVLLLGLVRGAERAERRRARGKASEGQGVGREHLSLREIFERAHAYDGLVAGLKYFVAKVLKDTELVEGEKERRVVEKGVVEILAALTEASGPVEMDEDSE